MIQWQTQDRNITTNIKVTVDFTLPALSATDVVTWKCHVYESAKGRYDIILGTYPLKEFVLNIIFSKDVIEADEGPFIGAMAHMVDLGAYMFKYLNTGSFDDAYVEEVYKSSHVCAAAKLLCIT